MRLLVTSRSPEALLSVSGVELALALSLVVLKLMNVVQAAVTVGLFLPQASHGHLALACLGLYLACSLLVVIEVTRVRRPVGWCALLDVAVAVVVILAAPSFQPRTADAWTQWPVAVSFLAVTSVVVTWSTRVGLIAVTAALVSMATWAGRPGGLRFADVVANGWVPCVGFAVGAALCIGYIRNLAALADSRADAIRQFEGERTRRLLHTPYRLLIDHAALLRDQLDGTGGQGSVGVAVLRSRLEEVRATVEEIEAVVRGTEVASSNLAADLRRLAEQFADLPLLLDVRAVTADLEPQTVARIREAVRSLLQNVRLHARAREVVVRATCDGDVWSVSVYDDGRGFDPAEVHLGVGLRESVAGAMRDVGAEAVIESQPGGGTLALLVGGLREPGKTVPQELDVR